MLQNKILLKIFGYKLSALFVSSIIYINLLRQLSSFLSLLLIDKSLIFPSFLPMAFSHNSFRIAIYWNYYHQGAFIASLIN